MKVEDFAAWLSAISGMSEDQRREAMGALEKASVVGGAAAASAKKGGKRGRQEDALGTTGVERVAAQGCPHCAGREVVGWGRSHGLLRFRCKSCGRTFNALTKTPMAPLRKKEKWLDHARAMIEGKSLAKTAQLCGVHPTTAVPLATSVSARAGSPQAAKLKRDRRSGRDLRPRILQRPMVRSAALRAQTRRQGQASRALSGQYSRSRRPRPEGRDLRRGPASGRRGFHRKSACRRGHTGQPSDRRRRPANRRLRPQSRDSVPRGARARKANPASAPSAHQQRQRLSRPPQTVAQPLQRRRHQEPAKLSWMAPRPRSLGRQTRTAKLDQRRDRKRTIPTANAIRADFFIWIRCNPLKGPDSDEQNQGNPSDFIWFCLVLFGVACTALRGRTGARAGVARARGGARLRSASQFR